jgi:hypothetical protein
VKLLKAESSKLGLAPSSVFVLIEWSSLTIQQCATDGTQWQANSSDLITAHALLLELLCSQDTRPSVKQSALVVTRRALRKVVRSKELGHNAMEAVVSQLAEKGGLGYKAAPLLGVAAGVCARLSDGSKGAQANGAAQSPKRSLEKLKLKYYTFWVREVVGSKALVPHHVSESFKDFFSSFATIEDIEEQIIPALEKTLLRAPEVVLNDLVKPMVAPLPGHYDLSSVLANRLMKPLLSNLKSTNSAIREGALSAFVLVLERSQDQKQLEKIMSEVLTPLATSKIPSAEQRAAHARLLAAIPPSVSRSRTIYNGLSTIVMKEANEAAATAEVQAIAVHITYLLLETPESIDGLAAVFVKGLGDKRAPVQKQWALRLGGLLQQLKHSKSISESVTQLFEGIVPKLLDIFKDVAANPIPSAQSGVIVVGYVFTAYADFLAELIDKPTIKSQIQKAKIFEQALTFDAKPSFLLNYRAYAKLNGEDELIWFVRALAASSTHVVKLGSSTVSNAWMQAYIYAITTPSATSTLRNEGTETLSKACKHDPSKIGPIVISGLWTWYRSFELNVKESAAVAAQGQLDKQHLVIRTICSETTLTKDDTDDASRALMHDQLLSMLVLCRSELLPRVSWIDTCLTAGVDPGELVRARAQDCVDHVNMVLSDNSIYGPPTSTIMKAAFNTLAELAFIAPETILPILVEQFSKDLSSDALGQFGPTEFAIARTPEGTPFVDVLSTKNASTTLDKNASNYDTLKWEAEVRAQLAAKKGTQKKLTADEQAKVNAQLKRESEIRAQVEEVERYIRRGVGTVQALATGPPTDADVWMSPATNALSNLVAFGVGQLVGDVVDDAYISCSNFVTHRLGSLKPFIGVATLRAVGSTSLSEELKEEPLEDLVTRTLYRLRLAGEQRPFDSVSLNYMIPLICVILQKQGAGQIDADGADEQITLALEFLSYHTDIFQSLHLPRGHVLSVLIHSMQQFNQHYKLIKDCLLDLVRAISDNMTPEELTILVRGAIVPQIAVRTAVLQATREDADLTELDFSDEIWLSCHDDEEENSVIAKSIWEENALEAHGRDALKLMPYLESSDKQLRRAAARSIAACVSLDANVFAEVLRILQDTYKERAKPRVPERDQYGMIKKMDLSDPWEARSGIALSLQELAALWQASSLVPFIEFMVNSNALGDQNASVRDEMISSAISVIKAHGAEKLEDLMAMFENALDATGKDTGMSDQVSEAIVILYGALAQHLPKGDARVPKVVKRLLETLSTPSESVQYAVAGCLPPLVRTSPENASEYIQHVLDELLQSKKYATRRGAAYGLAGIIKGKGVAALRENRIMTTLRSAGENKKDQNGRQGALFAYELLSLILQRVFEPYVIQIVPQLIASFGDTSADVREACLDASKVCFSNLSSYGVKVILPTLLEGLDESQWRSKKGACDLLGAMAYLDPQQLALSLPDIIPPLTNVLNDSHKEVRNSANRSLQRFGEVISNPEIKSLVNVLLKALSDPTKHTDDALDALIKVSFVHYLDAPSLALVVRILERGLGDRSATKRKSAQIIGSLAHLTERKDLTSHLPILVAGLRSAVVDPVPTTRATSSKALGSLVEKLGEDALPDLIPGLMATLKSDTGAGDRLGSAQALSEVLAGLGTGRLEETLPTILQNVSSNKPSVREGFMSLFIYLPACFGNSFANYLSKIIPPILAGLADDIESIRETSLRAGRLLVKNFATKAIDLLLPELDRGLADDSHRIRLSSVELVGDLLFNLTGISGKTEEEEEDAGATEAGASLLEVLGEDKRNKILSSLYICRCDTSGLVRTAAVNVWKALVATPRTLKELVPTLTQAIIRRLASSNMEQKVIAGNALGELIRKAGEGVLATLLPTLEEGLQTSTDVDNRQGICIALREIISSSSEEALEDYEKTLISVVRAALVDSDDEVRETAAEAFDSLQQIFGKKAVDQVLPHLLNLLRTEDEAETALAALLTLLTDNTRSNIILPNLIPTLIISPITAFNAKALASLAEVAGGAMSRRLPHIFNALTDNIIACKDAELQNDLEASFDAILCSLDEYDGLNTAMSVLLSLMKNDDHKKRANTAQRFGCFFTKAEIDFSRYNQDLIRVLLLAFDDRDSAVVKAAWSALTELMKRLRKEEMESLVPSTRQVVQQVGVAGHNLPGFCLPKGINAILPIFLQGLMNGTTEQRTQSALAISDIIDRTSADALKPFVTNITGPLIRVVTERSVDLRSAILLTLNNLLEKIPLFLKPFLPQLQRTFAKSLADTSSDLLRSRAAKALGTLLTLKPRVDPLIAELVTGAKTAETGVRNAMLKALYEVVSKAGDNMSEASRNSILGLIDSDSGEGDESMVVTNARLLGALVKVLPAGDAIGLIKQRALGTKHSYNSVLSLNSILLEAPSALTSSFSQETPVVICSGMASRQPQTLDNCVLAAGKYLLHCGDEIAFETAKSIFEALANVVLPGNPTDSRRLALVVIRTVARRHSAVVRPHLAVLTPPVFASLRDMVIPVKLAAEAAFIGIFDVVESEGTVFEKYMAGDAAKGLNAQQKRSMQDYFKRVALRLAGQARERKEAEGGAGGLGLSSDELEDEREIMSVGKVELSDVFKDD